MKNQIIKKSILLIIIFCFTLNTFAAVVSDNDGGSFITKA